MTISASTTDLLKIAKKGAAARRKGGLKTVASTGHLLNRNRISFGSNSILVFEKQIADHDEDHKNTVWFSHKEMEAIRNDVRSSVKRGELDRGLESRSRDTRIQHTASILKVHREHRRWGITNDGECLHLLSRAMSHDDIALAQKLASVDSHEALQEHLSTPETCLTRTSSKLALDNFQRTMHAQKGKSNTPTCARLHSQNLEMRKKEALAALNGDLRNLPRRSGSRWNGDTSSSGRETSNATYARKIPLDMEKPNIWQAMAMRKQERRVAGVAGVA